MTQDHYSLEAEQGDDKVLGLFAEKVRDELDTLKDNLDEHLDAINDNTNEIEDNFEHLQKVESKIDLLASKIDSITDFLEKKHGFKSESANGYDIKPLKKKEKHFFLIFYTLDDMNKGKVTYAQIAKKMAISERLAQNYVSNLISKGIPILKKYSQKKAYLSLKRDFKTLQAKENIVGVEQRILPI